MLLIDVFERVKSDFAAGQEVYWSAVAGGNTTFFGKDTEFFYGQKVFIDGTERTVTEIVKPDGIRIQGTVSNPKLWTMPTPNFIYGTAKDVNERLSESPDAVYPIVWLVLPAVSDEQEDRQSFTSHDVRIFFLDFCADDQTAQTAYFGSQQVRNMTSLWLLFKGLLEDQPRTKAIRNLTVTGLPKFGITDQNGAEQSVLNEILSGIEVRFSLDYINC
jgi:hypothetical protein